MSQRFFDPHSALLAAITGLEPDLKANLIKCRALTSALRSMKFEQQHHAQELVDGLEKKIGSLSEAPASALYASLMLRDLTETIDAVKINHGLPREDAVVAAIRHLGATPDLSNFGATV